MLSIKCYSTDETAEEHLHSRPCSP